MWEMELAKYVWVYSVGFVFSLSFCLSACLFFLLVTSLTVFVCLFVCSLVFLFSLRESFR